jgi:hypothetical protein
MMGHTPGSRVTEQFYIFADEAAKRAAILELPVSNANGDNGATPVAISGNAP